MKIHLTGIGGTGMGSLAGLLKAARHDVRGSDTALYPPMSTQLAEQAIPVMEGFGPQNLAWGPEQIVVGNVCSKDHVEVKAAEAAGIPLTSFPALLESAFLTKSHSMVVAGTHGKTTTSSLLSFVLTEAGLDPSFLVGGVPLDYQRGWRLGFPFREGSTQPAHGPASGVFVVEGDEYDTAFFDKGSKFFHYAPKTAILTSIELDHIDIFDSLDAIKASFRRFVELIPESGLLVVAADSPNALDVAKHARCRVATYAVATEGTAIEADYIAKVVATRTGGRTLFEIHGKGERLGPFDLGMPGTYNLANALAVSIAALDVGVPVDSLAIGLRRFGGVKRRQEVVGVAQGVTVIDDFAHHPTAVRETLRGLRGRHGQGRLIAVYEPRSATSRRARFQSEFAEAFTWADELLVGAVDHPEKAPEGDRFDPERLASDVRERGIAARYMPEINKMVDHLTETAAAGDTVVIMSSGSFGGIYDKLLGRLGDPVVPAKSSDVPAVRALLSQVKLAYPDVEDRVNDLLVIRDPVLKIAACVSMELYRDAGVLRALVTAPERRGEGLGWMMAAAALERARSRGLRRVFLVTESASDFFAEKFGFQVVSREVIDEAVLASSNFRELSERATTMQLELD